MECPASSRGPGRAGCRPGGIVQGGGLGWDDLQKAQIKVLLPAHQSVVCSAKDQQGLSGVQQHGEGGKLHFPLRVQAVLIEREGQGGEAGSGEESLQQGKIMPAPHPVLCLLLRQGEEGLRRLLKGDGQAGGVRDQLLKPDIGQGGENQAVHRAEGDLGQGDIPPPGEVIEQI